MGRRGRSLLRPRMPQISTAAPEALPDVQGPAPSQAWSLSRVAGPTQHVQVHRHHQMAREYRGHCRQGVSGQGPIPQERATGPPQIQGIF